MNKRIPIGKRLRFEIFARDGFTCRYCGRQSDVVQLHVDHVIPVCQGGTNDPENLVAACADCNLGKSGKTINQSAPTEADRLRILQEMREQEFAASMAKSAAESRKARRQELVNFWCGETGNESADRQTISTVLNYAQEFGDDVVYGWVEKAAVKCSTDSAMGRYISGIRRLVKAENEQ